MGKPILLTGDRPTGKLHLGHFVGSLKQRVKLQNSGKYRQYVFIADLQALTDNARNPELIRQNIIEVALDYLAVGIDPNKSTIFVQSQIPELAELTIYYMNLVTLGRLQRNPTVKDEIKQKKIEKSLPVGFLNYPISQAADITAFKANYVPAGEDQIPIIEQAREIVRSFNSIYGNTLIEPEIILPDQKTSRRLPGLDGKSKMGKSLGNAIYLSDRPDTIKDKIMNMFTDPGHIKKSDPGNTKNNPVFIYLNVFSKDRDLYEEMKKSYEKGGLGDVEVKSYLNGILQSEIDPIREKREKFAKDIPAIYDMLLEGSKNARVAAADTLLQVRKAIGVEYFKTG